jgi:L-serine dehydratase
MIKSIEVNRRALVGDGSCRVSLDQPIETMQRTGLVMTSYKETAQRGLTVNVVEC